MAPTSTDRSTLPRLRRRSLERMPGLDGVRAIAVLAVLVFHANENWLPGGFLGVDVFFTLSGFLITSLLLTEIGAAGGIHLGRFYQRRAKRLLPALLLVLVATSLLAMTVAQDAAARVREDIVASAFYVTNWWYVLHGTSYFEATGRPPLLQHLWSLAVEEQFYLVWPLLVYGLWRLGRARAVRIAQGGDLGRCRLAHRRDRDPGRPADPSTDHRTAIDEQLVTGLDSPLRLCGPYQPAVSTQCP